MISIDPTASGLIRAAQSPPMSDHLVRVGHLKDLQRLNSWSDSELARHCRRTPQQLRSWFLAPGQPGSRQIGEKLARNLEDALGLGQYALDSRPTSAGRDTVNVYTLHSGGSPQAGVSVRNKAREMPILMWAQLQSMLRADNATLRTKAPHLETFAPSSSGAKFVQVQDDSMSPDFAVGDHVLLDPAEAPRAGDIVLVSLPHGEMLLRVFRPRTAHIFECVPLNPHYLPVSSQDDGAEVAAVLVEHRRYRRTG